MVHRLRRFSPHVSKPRSANCDRWRRMPRGSSYCCGQTPWRLQMNTTVLPSVLALSLVMIGVADAAVVATPVAYQIDGETFEGTLVYDDAVTTPRPGLIMVPNWLGVTDRATEKAARAASDKYVVLIADLYGKAIRPSNPEEARAAA